MQYLIMIYLLKSNGWPMRRLQVGTTYQSDTVYAYSTLYWFVTYCFLSCHWNLELSSYHSFTAKVRWHNYYNLHTPMKDQAQDRHLTCSPRHRVLKSSTFQVRAVTYWEFLDRKSQYLLFLVRPGIWTQYL